MIKKIKEKRAAATSLHVRLPEDVKDDITSICNSKGIDVSFVVRRLIKGYIDGSITLPPLKL